LQPGYSLRALNNKFKLLVLIIRQWPDLNGFLRRMTSALGPDGFNGWVWIASVWCSGLTSAMLGPHNASTWWLRTEVVAGQFPALLLLGRDESLRCATCPAIRRAAAWCWTGRSGSSAKASWC
jgi:hypothetical protein